MEYNRERGLRGRVELGGMGGAEEGIKGWWKVWHERMRGRRKKWGRDSKEVCVGGGGEGDRGKDRRDSAGSFNWSLYPCIHHYFMCCLTFVRLTHFRLLQLFDRDSFHSGLILMPDLQSQTTVITTCEKARKRWSARWFFVAVVLFCSGKPFQ